MADTIYKFIVKSNKEEAEQIRLITVDDCGAWGTDWVPGMVGIIGVEEVGETYLAIASSPEDKGGLEFLIKGGSALADAMFNLNPGDLVTAKGPLGKGYPPEKYKGRDVIFACVGTAIAPVRSAIRYIMNHRAEFGKVVLAVGARYVKDFAFLSEADEIAAHDIKVLLTVSAKEEGWTGVRGHVQDHFEELIKDLNNPVAVICGMKEMMNESREKLTALGVSPDEILTNF